METVMARLLQDIYSSAKPSSIPLGLLFSRTALFLFITILQPQRCIIQFYSEIASSLHMGLLPRQQEKQFIVYTCIISLDPHIHSVKIR